ncbi:MAG TPA: cytochrome c4 [Gammaproteobacteria bacterium]|nr:cytochrome c4 [Gammaproteobacteria bacterium]
MNKILLSAALLGFSSWVVAAPGNIAKGEKLATEGYCYTCHGDKGVAPSRNAPSLAGQSASYTAKILKEYKEGKLKLDNKSLGMQGITEPMTSQDIADISAYYAAQKRAPSNVKGQAPASAAGCAGCHPISGAPGMGGAAPSLSGMSPGYLNRQLTAFRDGKRGDAMMNGLMSKLTDGQIEEISHYYGGQ